jgi:hypothetical protein
MVSKAWKELSPDERQPWDDRAQRDKARYEIERSMYAGPWKVPADKKRAVKDPNAPKRPMSAFLAFSHTKRSEVRQSNPKVSNTEICRILSQHWKDAPFEVKKLHVDQEFELRQEYKAAIAVWREEAERQKKRERQDREDIALRAVADIQNHQHDEDEEAGVGATRSAAGFVTRNHLSYGGYDDKEDFILNHSGVNKTSSVVICDRATTTFRSNDHDGGRNHIVSSELSQDLAREYFGGADQYRPRSQHSAYYPHDPYPHGGYYSRYSSSCYGGRVLAEEMARPPLPPAPPPPPYSYYNYASSSSHPPPHYYLPSSISLRGGPDYYMARTSSGAYDGGPTPPPIGHAPVQYSYDHDHDDEEDA